MNDDSLDDFVRRSLPKIDVPRTREDRLADAVLARVDGTTPAANLSASIARFVVPMASAAGLGALSGLLLPMGERLSLGSLFTSATSILAAF